MFTTLTVRLVGAWLAIGELLQRRGAEFARQAERGDESISKALFAALVVGLGTLIAGAITAFVNGKLPLIGGH